MRRNSLPRHWYPMCFIRFRSRSHWFTFFVLKTMLVNPSKKRVLISLYALVYKKKSQNLRNIITDSVTLTKFEGGFRLLN